jgi:arabinofuranosyltransferase
MLNPAFAWGPDSPLARYLQSLRDAQVWFWAVAVGALLVLLVERLARLHGRARATAMYGIATVVAACAVYRSYELAWLSDDAFISFRYARNWVAGQGLVYNPGERVEGYTNFLWTTLIALGLRLGLGAELWSMFLSFASLAGVIGLTTRLLARMSSYGRAPVVSLAGILLATNYTFTSYGTSGLETMAATFLVLLAAERADARAFVAAGFAAIAATMMHPDHALFYATLGAAIALSDKNRWQNLVRYAVAFVVLFIPYYLVRWRYYGDFFPNTYYSKSGGAAYYSQGQIYLWVSALAAGAVAMLPFSIWGTFLYRRHIVARFAVLAVPAYLAYVAKIGGDFMLGRLLCAILPYVFLMAELAVRRFCNRRQSWAWAVAGIGTLALAAVPNGVVKPWEKYFNIADERTVYRLKTMSPIEVATGFTPQAKALLRAFDGAPRPPVVAVGCIGVVGWLTNYPIMDNWGLVTRSVAHMQIRQRGRPGHEKLATPGHAFEYGVDFSDITIWPEPYDSWTTLDIGGFKYLLAKYDAELNQTLQKNQSAVLPNIDWRLRFYATTTDRARLDCDHWFFETIYYSSPGNDNFRKELTGKWVAARPELAGVEDLLFRAPAPGDPNWRSQTLFSFDDLQGWTASGEAFSEDPTEGDLPGQGHAAGTHGKYANSLHSEAFDAATGTLVSPPFVIHGDAITLRIGGGMLPDSEVARLLVDGKVVASSTGCNTEIAGRRVWPVGPYRGKQAVLEIVDSAKGAWSHVLVDDVVEWSRAQSNVHGQ